MKHINEQQTDLDLMIGEYPIIDELKIGIKPYEELWNLYVLQEQKLVKQWKQGAIGLLDPDEVEQEFKKMFGTANKLAARFEQSKLPNPMKTAQKIKKDLFDFRPFLPIIRALCNPGLQKRHIDQIRTLINT